MGDYPPFLTALYLGHSGGGAAGMIRPYDDSMRGEMRAISVVACAGLLLTSLVAPAGGGAGHDAVNFTRSLGRIREGSSGNTFDADLVRGTHGRGPASVEVHPRPGEVGNPATSQDYNGSPKTVDFPQPIDAGTASIPVVNDGETEDPETVTLTLQNPTSGMVAGFPKELTFSILDNDGPARLAFELAEYEVFENAEMVRAYVVRSGNISGEAEIHYATASGTAAASDDYITKSGTLNFDAGDDFKWIDIALVDDAIGEESEEFSITLSSPEGTSLEDPATTSITIHDEAGNQTVDFTPPYTAFHQPLHRKKYRPKEIKTFIAFMQDNDGGTGMKRVDLAIRMKRDNGSCRWWNGTGFRKGSCSKKRWADTGRGTETKVGYFSDTAVFELGKALKGSGPRSDIRNYTAYCRGRDIAGNFQDNFDKGQNRNTFNVRGGG